jgi:predicted phosphohydrolase
MNINTKEAVNGTIIKDVVVLEIKEALPPSKKLFAETHDYWLDLIHAAIGKAALGQKLPYFEKAFVLIEITTPKYTDNTQLWDTSNRAINLVINNLKGTFFDDDNFEHMAFGVIGNWGEIGRTVIKIMPFEKFAELIENQ